VQSPYTRHFLEALEYMLKEGTIPNQAEFCRVMDLDDNAISAYRRGARNVTIHQLNKQFTIYGVSPKYQFTGKGAIMEPSPKEPTPEEKSELQKRAELAENTVRLQQSIIAEKNKRLEDKDKEIRYLRELLRQKVKKKGEKDS
jgi:transcriptional regulator with XRE-family HTH domain